MPTMSNMTVKKNDGTTDVIYTMQAQSAGDRSPAIWQNLTVGAASGHRPELRMACRPNAAGTARRVDISFTWKQVSTDTTTGLTKVVNQMPFTLSVPRPLDMPDADVNEAVSQFFNCLNQAQVKDGVKQAFAPS